MHQMNTIAPPAAAIEGVSHCYGARQALDDVTFSVAPSTFTVLLGGLVVGLWPGQSPPAGPGGAEAQAPAAAPDPGLPAVSAKATNLGLLPFAGFAWLAASVRRKNSTRWTT